MGDDIFLDIGIGAAIIVFGAIVYVARFLYKKKKRKNPENDIELTIEMEEIEIKKKTAADHIEEIKQATQKVLQPIRNSTMKERNPSNSTLSLSLPEEKKSSVSSTPLQVDSERSSASFSRHSSSNSSLSKNPPKKVPPPPPPSPLKANFDDDNRTDAKKLEILLSNASRNIANPNNSKRIASQKQSRSTSRSTSTLLDLMPSSETQSGTNTPNQKQKSSINPHNKETIDYTSFQSLRKIKSTQNVHPKKRRPRIETMRTGGTVKTESQDEEIILDAISDEKLKACRSCK